MADQYEYTLAAKTGMTTSDFIRVVGSDNVSYKQPISDVLNVQSGGVKMALLSKTVTIAAGSATSPTEVTVTFDDAPANFQGAIVFLGAYQLPYIGVGSTTTYTWIHQISGKAITIRNTAGNWNSYTMFVLGFFRA